MPKGAPLLDGLAPDGLLNKEKAMSTAPGQVRARSSSPEAERMRLYRKRRQEGIRYVRIPLHVMEVDVLIRIGRLKEDSRTDAEVLQAAVLSLLYRALGETEIGREMLRYV